MGKARNLADLLDDNGDVKSASLDNVPASNNASALTTGTLPIARIADGTVTAAKVAADVATQAELDAAGVGGATGVDFNDNVKVRFGTGNDAEIYHDGTHTYYKNSHTSGSTRFNQKYFEVNNTAGTESMLSAYEDGAVTLRHNSATKLETTAAGISVTGTVTQSGNKTQIFVAQYDGTTTGTTTLGSLGFKPMALWCLFKVNNASVASWGFAGRQGGQSVLYDNKIHNSSTHWASDSSYIGRLRFGSSNDVNLAVTTWNDNEVVITRSKSGSGNSSACAYKILVMG